MGRPIMHKGDPDDPALTDKERRRIKRRIANRESAQRVRHRRQEEMEEMQLKACAHFFSFRGLWILGTEEIGKRKRIA